MVQIKLTAPVGKAPRTSEGKPVKNKASDVVLVRQMLASNGIGPLGDSKTMDTGLIKAIGVFQKKMGFKSPDHVIDPGGKTFKALEPKYAAQIREAAKVVTYEVKFRNMTLTITADDLKMLQKDVFKRLTPYMRSIIRSHKQSLKTYQDYLDTAMMKDGYMNAFTQVLIIKVGSVKWPDSKLASRAIKASGKLEQAIKSKDMALLEKALPEAEKAINAFNADVMRFLYEFSGSAQTTGVVLSVASAVSFAVVGALAMPVLVTGAGIGVGTATVASSTGVGILQSASQELGSYASGQKKMTVWGSVKSIAIDGAISGLTAGIGAKIPLGFIKKMAKPLAARLASKVPFMTGKQLEKFITSYLVGSGEAVIKSSISQVIKLFGIMVKSGKMPTEKDFDAAIEDLIYTALLGGLVKNLGRFQTKWLYKNKSMLTGTLFPASLAKLAKGTEIPKTLQVKLWAEVMNKVSDKALKAGYHEVYNRATGNETDKQLADMAGKAMLKDRELQSLIDREMAKALKKHGIAVKK